MDFQSRMFTMYRIFSGSCLFMIALLYGMLCCAAESVVQEPAPAQANALERVFFSPTQSRLCAKLIELINAEQRSLKIAIFTMTDPRILWAIKRASDRNVAVDIVIDKRGLAKLTSDLQAKFGGMIPANVRIMQCVLPDIKFMHHKFVIFEKNKADQSLLWVGSYNFTYYEGSELLHDNAVLLADEPTIAVFRNEFARLLGQAAGAQPEVQELMPAIEHAPIREAFFSPGGGCEQALLDLIRSANGSIKIVMDEFTNFTLVQALADRPRQLARLTELIIFKCETEQNAMVTQLGYDCIDTLQKAGVEVYKYKPVARELMHNKFAVFGNNHATVRGKNAAGKSLVWTGSYNFTTAAEANNCESAVLLDDPYYVHAFESQFQMLKGKYAEKIMLKPRAIYVMCDSELPAASPLKRQKKDE